MAGAACANSQSRGKRTGLVGGGVGSGAGATGGVISAEGAAEASGNEVAGVVRLFGGNGRVTVGLAELAFRPDDATRTPDGTPRRTAGKHSRFARAR